MTARQRTVWTWSAVGFVVFAAVIGALVERATHRLAAGVESRFGWKADIVGADEFVSAMGREGVFASAAPDAMAVPIGQDVFLWRAADKASRKRYGIPFKVSNQASVGSCVAHGAQHAVYLAEAVAWEAGLRGEVPLRPSTPSIYGGSRVEARGRPGDGRQPYGGFSDGSTGFHAAKWVRDWGITYQQPYTAFGFDLTNGQHLERDWGAYGNGGKNDDGKFDAEAKKHPIQKVSRVSTWTELVHALSAGMPVTIASNVGFQASARDADGFIRRNGTWPHQMAVAGLRWAKNAPPGTKNPRDGALVLNSWDVTWPPQGGGKFPADQPDGSFWIVREDFEEVAAAGDSWAYSTTANWEPVPLDNGNWLQPAPAAARPQSARLIADTFSLAP
jgi:hypothetical protein